MKEAGYINLMEKAEVRLMWISLLRKELQSIPMNKDMEPSALHKLPKIELPIIHTLMEMG